MLKNRIENPDKRLIQDEVIEKLPFEPVDKFFNYMQSELKLSKSKAFSIIYYLQECFEWEDENVIHHGLIPDEYEQCHAKGCGELFDSFSEGCSALRCDAHACLSGNCDTCRKLK